MRDGAIRRAAASTQQKNASNEPMRTMRDAKDVAARLSMRYNAAYARTSLPHDVAASSARSMSRMR